VPLNKIICISVLFYLLLFSVRSYAEINTVSEAINKAGQQRMLSQRVVATYCQLGLDIQAKKSKGQLRRAIKKFDENLLELNEYKSNEKVNKQLQIVADAWQPVKKIALAPVHKDKAEELRALAENVLSESHKMVVILQDESNLKEIALVNIAGRQRMLSQRLSSLYMLQSWGFSRAEYASDYILSIDEFSVALSELNKSTVNTAEIKSMLKAAKKQFAMLRKSLQQKNGVYIPLMVKMSADKLLLIMDEITHKYEKLLAG